VVQAKKGLALLTACLLVKLEKSKAGCASNSTDAESPSAGADAPEREHGRNGWRGRGCWHLTAAGRRLQLDAALATEKVRIMYSIKRRIER
jgi:hypothetical protein